MRIGIFTNYFSPSVGGLENSVMSLCAGLKKSGHEVFVFAPKYSASTPEEKNVFRCPSIRFKYGGYLYAVTLPFFSSMDALVKDLHLDVIHSQQPFLLGEEALRFSKKFGIPIVFTYHTKYEDNLHYIPIVSRLVPKDWIINKAVAYLNKCDHVISPSTSIKKFVLSRGAKAPISVIPSGINMEKFGKDGENRKKIREKYRIANDEIVLFTACRLAREKNIEFLVNAFSGIVKNNKKVKYLIVGDGPAKKYLEEMVKKLGLEKSIIFVGWVSGEHIAGYYKAGDIFVYASLTETQGLVVAEAVVAGLPVVAVNASGTEDAVVDGETGFLTENLIDDFSEKALAVINNAELRSKMAAQAKTSSEKFSEELWIKNIVGLYESLI